MTITGMELIQAERTRQVEVEGWTPEHDDAHGGRVLWEAAQCYEAGAPAGVISLEVTPFSTVQHALRWPWEIEAWKPGTAPRNLIRAGALYLAAAECFRRTRDDRPNKPWPLANGQTEADRVAWVLWLADLCEASARNLAGQLDEWLAFAAQVTA